MSTALSRRPPRLHGDAGDTGGEGAARPHSAGAFGSGMRLVSSQGDAALAPLALAAGPAPFAAALARLRQAAPAAFQYAVFPLSVLLLWWYASSAELLPSNILPGPGAVLASFLDLLHGGGIAEHLFISLWRVVQGAALGLVLGLALGAALGASPAFESWIGPSFRVMVQIPSIALIPLLMMVLGIEDSLKLFIMTKACVVPLALVTADGIRNIPPAYLEVARVMKLSRWTLYRRVVLPGALPAIATGVRQGIAHVWVALVAVEVMASAEGIGYLMTWSRQIFQLDVVLVCVALIGLIGFSLDYGLRRAETRLLRWRGRA
ncbi:ABC transporter permease [Thauera linaloolentis]|uniref:ABC transporter permease n=1 Tax=Thauera linaloolentis (strain DSM 12138 / JCM 21573 / CCUG 41526 / CIP 105981 / IAM 15112 / NBRC 102519 / 47Lol) TaxID=1123367 RepID=N6YNA5_THAL4|nr:ABC transporter permease [Thauera linaloolentis]ENO83663.1 ABC transporter permease [Thauera linaloolentis 47Lol = DSM 12138]MCM8564247.1 ABC transporter permease [Thauera linaloolentis]